MGGGVCCGLLAVPHIACDCCSACAATIALNPAGSTTSYFDNTQDPISADVGSRRQYAPDVVTGE